MGIRKIFHLKGKIIEQRCIVSCFDDKALLSITSTQVVQVDFESILNLKRRTKEVSHRNKGL